MASSNNVHTFNDQNFDAEVLAADTLVLVDFTASWCAPCHQLTPIVEGIATELIGRVKVGKLDVDENPEISARYGIRGVPTVIVFLGGERKAQLVGLANRDRLVGLLGLT